MQLLGNVMQLNDLKKPSKKEIDLFRRMKAAHLTKNGAGMDVNASEKLSEQDSDREQTHEYGDDR